MLFFDEFVKKMRKIKIFKIDCSFFIVFVIAFLLEEVILYFYFALFTVLHELTHFIVARKLGYLPRKIHLTFLVHLLKVMMISQYLMKLRLFWLVRYLIYLL